MNVLPRAKQEQVIAALVEGASVRSVERLTGVHRDTILRLMTRVGRHCFELMDREIRGVACDVVQCDELWGYVSRKDKRISPDEALAKPEIGSQYVFVAMDKKTKLVPAFEIGKRTPETTNAFMRELRGRVSGQPTIITDGFGPYAEAVRQNFGRGVHHAMLVKTFKNGQTPIREGYAPAHRIVECTPIVVQGRVERADISTSLIERQNLTMRMHCRRLTRLTNAFSKKLENLVAALCVHFAWYNFVRIHRSLRITPAMAAGIAKRPWSISDLIPGSVTQASPGIA